MQKNILEENPSADLRVYVVWMPILRNDSEMQAYQSRLLLSDDRVTHFWNGDRFIGMWFKQNVATSYYGSVLWDAYLLYDEAAQWETIPLPLIGWGQTVIGSSEKLKQELNDLLGE